MISGSPKIDRLLLAIAEFEGWSYETSKTPPGGSRSYRNHNPGNLRASPFASDIKDGFAVFASDTLGFMALHWDIMQKARGNTVTDLGPKSTLGELFSVYAPVSDGNDPVKYMEFITTKTGLSPHMTLGELFAK